MKTIPIALATHYALPQTTVCTCLKVTRGDAVVVGFTDHDKTVTVDGVDYLPGFDVSSLSSSEGLAVDNMELSILADDDLPASDLLTGLWNNAQFEVFEVNYESVSDGVNVLKRGTTGEVRLWYGVYIVEFRGLTQALQQNQGIATNKTCRAIFGDSKCTLDVADFTQTGAITAVVDQRQFTGDNVFFTPDWYGEGIIEFLTGDNAGYRQKVKTYSSGEFITSLPFPFPVQVGDTFSAIAGCRKRLAEDCRDKHDNVLNFQGEPHLPGIDKLTKSGLSEDQPASDPVLPEEGA